MRECLRLTVTSAVSVTGGILWWQHVSLWERTKSEQHDRFR